MSIKIGDTVKVHTTGDDRLDWAAGLTGEIVNRKMITVPSGQWDENMRPLYYTYHQVTVRTSQGEVTVNDNEVTKV